MHSLIHQLSGHSMIDKIFENNPFFSKRNIRKKKINTIVPLTHKIAHPDFVIPFSLTINKFNP